MIVMEPLEVTSSSEAFGDVPLALPNKTPDRWRFDFFATSKSASLNLMDPFDVLASNWVGLLSDRFTEIAPLLVSNLHFPSNTQSNNRTVPLLELAWTFPAEFSIVIFPLLVVSCKEPAASLTSIFPLEVLMVTEPRLWLVKTLPFEVVRCNGQLAGTFNSRLTESDQLESWFRFLHSMLMALAVVSISGTRDSNAVSASSWVLPYALAWATKVISNSSEGVTLILPLNVCTFTSTCELIGMTFSKSRVAEN